MTGCITVEETKQASGIIYEENNATRSYAYVEHLGDGVARLELRLTPTNFVPPDEGGDRTRYRHPRKTIEILEEELIASFPDVKQMDVIVVEHIEGVIQKFCYIDAEETQRRRERAKARRQALRRRMNTT